MNTGKGLKKIMKFKNLTNHYEDLDKKELIKNNFDEIERLTKELKRVKDSPNSVTSRF